MATASSFLAMGGWELLIQVYNIIKNELLIFDHACMVFLGDILRYSIGYCMLRYFWYLQLQWTQGRASGKTLALVLLLREFAYYKHVVRNSKNTNTSVFT